MENDLINCDIIDDHTKRVYHIDSMISHGSFGRVYICHDEKKRKYALKYPIMPSPVIDTFKNEVNIYNHLRRELKKHSPPILYIPRYRIIKYNDKLLILNELLGDTIDKRYQPFLSKKKGLPLRELVLLTIQLISCIKFIHSLGIIHQDLKLENFLFGQGEYYNQIFCIDFGLSKVYLDKGSHIPFKQLGHFKGTVRYAPLAAHKCEEQSRKDDLESLGYIFVYLFNGGLPWQNTTVKEKDKRKKKQLVENMKENIDLEKLTGGMPREYLMYMEYVKNLEYDEKPDYSALKKMFVQLSKKSTF
jgi:serine/threonine protein kinase